jgi:GT2 family glycosyltransferase
MKPESLYIIIPVHNRKHFTKQCLISLRSQTVGSFKIIVIDDGSTDGTSDMLEQEFPDVILLNGNGNLWWTKAINMGITYALDRGAEYIMTLNDDTIPRNDFVEMMLFWAKKNPNDLLCAFAIDVDSNKPVYGGTRINWLTAGSINLLNIIPKERWRGLHEVTHAPGRGLLIPRNTFDDIGLFDEKRFPHSLADFDYTHRACRNGHRIFCNYDAILHIYSFEGGDIKLRINKSARNYYYHLLGIKGGGNIRYFVYYALINSPRFHLLPFLIIGLTRRIFGYFIH